MVRLLLTPNRNRHSGTLIGFDVQQATREALDPWWQRKPQKFLGPGTAKIISRRLSSI